MYGDPCKGEVVQATSLYTGKNTSQGIMLRARGKGMNAVHLLSEASAFPVTFRQLKLHLSLLKGNLPLSPWLGQWQIGRG